MPDTNAVPIPQGATIGDPASAGVPIPEGATIGTPQSTQQNTPPPKDPNALEQGISDVADAGGRVATGFVKGAGQTVSGVSHLIHKLPGGIGEALAPEQGIEALDKGTETHGTEEAVGSGLESLAEFAAGDEALTGLTKMAKIAKAAPGLLEMAEKFPKTAKILMGAGKGAAVGGAQGAVKGAAKDNAVGEAEAGAAGGAVGGTLGETASEVAGALGKRFGVGTTAGEDAIHGIKPKKRNFKFAENFQTAAPRMDAEAQTLKPDSVEEWADTAKAARQKLWATEIQPLVDQHANVPLDGNAIANNIRAAIPETMKQYSPVEAKKMEDLANQFIPGGQMGSNAVAVPAHNTFVGGAEAALEHYNALVGKTGYWEKSPSVRADLMKTDGELAGNMATANAIRDELYSKLDAFEKARVQGQPTYPAQGGPAATTPARNIQNLKKEYGALRNVEDEIRGRINVVGGQSPTSLKETVGIITGLGKGGWAGAGIAGLPVIEKFANTPERQIARAVQKAARPGEEGAVTKIVEKGREIAGKRGGMAGAVMGEQADESMQSPRVYFQASDGSYHSIPGDQLKAAMAVDPHLTIINQ